MDKIYINTDFIKLQQALKLANVVGQGSDAKMLIQNGYVKVNGEVCTMRGKKLVGGEIVNFDDEVEFQIARED
jgi:S4 domain-containing protein